MRWLFGVLLITAVFAGCLGGDEAGGGADLEPSAEDDEGSPGESTDQGPGSQETREDEEAATGTAETPEDGNEASPVPWSLNLSAQLGWVAGAGVGFLGLPGAPDDQGTTDAYHCPITTFEVPEGAERVAGEITWAAADPDRPGAGLYTIVVDAPGEFTGYYDGSVALVEPAQMTFEITDEVEPGSWTLEARPEGATIDQVWTVELVVEGTALEPPQPLVAEIPCA